MNPGLEDHFDSRQQYFIRGFTHHCIRASTDSTDLKNELMQVSDLFSVFQTWHFAVINLPKLFAWLYKVRRHFTDVLCKIIHEYQADGAAGELSGHIQSLWDRYLISTFDQHAFNRRNIDIAGFLFLPEIWHSRWFSLVSGTTQLPDVILFRSDQYKHLLMHFFEDKDRSGRYHVDGTVYAHAALECFQNMFNPNDK